MEIYSQDHLQKLVERYDGSYFSASADELLAALTSGILKRNHRYYRAAIAQIAEGGQSVYHLFAEKAVDMDTNLALLILRQGMHDWPYLGPKLIKDEIVVPSSHLFEEIVRFHPWDTCETLIADGLIPFNHGLFSYALEHINSYSTIRCMRIIGLYPQLLYDTSKPIYIKIIQLAIRDNGVMCESVLKDHKVTKESPYFEHLCRKAAWFLKSDRISPDDIYEPNSYEYKFLKFIIFTTIPRKSNDIFRNTEMFKPEDDFYRKSISMLFPKEENL